MQYALKLQPFSFPQGGLLRYYNCAAVSADSRYLYVGTTGSDIIVLNLETAMFRASIPVGSNGVCGVVSLPNGDIVVGGADGSMKRIRGEDMSWEIVREVSFYQIDE